MRMRNVIKCNLYIPTRYLTGSVQDTLRRGVPLSEQEFRSRKFLPLVQPDAPRILRVAVIGDPNAGKSTLVNNLSGWRVCSVSAKVHTTRQNAAAVLTEDNKQVIFVDTPGLVTLQQGKKHHLEGSLLLHPKESLSNTDLALVIVDAANPWTRHRLSQHLMNLLKEHTTQIKTHLVLNKIDNLKSRQCLLDLIRILTANTVSKKEVGRERALPSAPKTMEDIFRETEMKMQKKAIAMSQVSPETKENSSGWPHFQRVFSVSALTGEGVGELRAHLLSSCKPGSWEYHPSVVTDQNPKELVIQVVREKFMDVLPKEIPYLLQISVEMWDLEPHLGSLKLAVAITCKKKSVVSCVLGPRGKNIGAVVERARQELANAFRCDVALKLLVKMEEHDKQ